MVICLADPDFVNLQEDNCWIMVEDKVITAVQKEMNDPYRDIPLMKRLLRMRVLDQAY